MQEKFSKWAVRLFVMALLVGVALAAHSQWPSQQKAESQLPALDMFSSNLEQPLETKAEEVIRRGFSRDLGAEVTITTISSTFTRESTEVMPAQGQDSVRVKVGHQQKVEHFQQGSPQAYTQKTSSEKWEVLHGRVRTTEMVNKIYAMNVLVFTPKELDTRTQARVSELLEFTLHMDRDRGDSIRFETPL